MMDGHRQLDDAEAGAKMAARNRHRSDGVVTQLRRQLLQLVDGKVSDIRRNLDRIKERRCRIDGQLVDPFPCPRLSQLKA